LLFDATLIILSSVHQKMFKIMSWLQARFTTYQQISKYALKHFMKNIQTYIIIIIIMFKKGG